MMKMMYKSLTTSSSNVPQDGEKDGRVENEDTQVSHEQMVVQAQDVDAPQPPPQVVNRINTPLLQDHPQDLIIGSLSKGVMTRSQKLASFIAHHSFVSCFEPTKVEEALQDPCMKSCRTLFFLWSYY